ncbi:MAG: GTPase obg, partial [candidate division CPR2 bacterium GW2011_GWD2_39_7]
GGKGGDVIFIADENLNTLVYFTTNRKIAAENGEDGRSHKKRGKSGEDLVVKVPSGTLLWDIEAGGLIADLSNDGDEVAVAFGGDGGYGNAHFTSSIRQAPEIAELGEPGEEKQIKLELKLIADVGLVGHPNVGKSTLLSVVTKAKPKIANYPFTTLIPNLGVVETLPDGSRPEEFGFVVADIPGLIEGAAEGKGLGDEFLRHIERTRLLVHIIDATSDDFLRDFNKINDELKRYNLDLFKKPMIVAISKIDLVPREEFEKKLKIFKKESLKSDANLVNKMPIMFSGVTHEGLRELLFEMNNDLRKIPKKETPKVEDYREYTLEERKTGFDVVEEEKGFRIMGPKVEKFAIRTDFNNGPAMYRFRHILKRIGIETTLRKMGAKEGDIIRIGDKTFEFKEF